MQPSPDLTPPEPRDPVEWEHYALWQRVRNALFAVPDHFSTPINIEGLSATDIFTLNAPLAATIEDSFVRTLNALRPVWDPNSEYQTHSFVRQAQTFPDVVLRTIDNGSIPLMGIEMKGWYLLAKEKAPTFRFTQTAAACNPWDLLVVVPWVLSNVLAGAPVLFRPFVQPARYCAEKRNFYWQHERDAASDTGIHVPDGISPYPAKSDQISDKAAADSGGNFGRLARYGIMDGYVRQMQAELVRGIPVSSWHTFF
ncbi:MAG: hypothetical protein OXG71_02590, partial [Rhodospirillales bacterium]|nr:hypothetical protein [Rhodospirillales bacterium]